MEVSVKKLLALALAYSLFAASAHACDVYTAAEVNGVTPTVTYLANGNFVLDDASGSHEYASVSASTGFSDGETFYPAMRAGIAVDGKAPGVSIEGSGDIIEIDGTIFAPACH